MRLETEQDFQMSFKNLPFKIPTLHTETPATQLPKMSTMKKIHSTTKLGKKSNHCLKKALKKNKTDTICREFGKKLKRLTIVDQDPPLGLVDQLEMKAEGRLEFLKRKLVETEGLEISSAWTVAWALLNSLQTIIIVFIASILLVFPQNKSNFTLTSFIYTSCYLHLVDILLSASVQHIEKGHRLTNLHEISRSYTKKSLKIDLLYLLSLLLLQFPLHTSLDLLTLFITFTKMFSSITRFDNFEHLYLTNMSMQKYYQVAKVILLNFMIAHIIAVVLLLMSQLGQGNWVEKHGLEACSWEEKYVWSYYWGVTIMLTVGFGDFAASNKNQALLLIFIETVSCILLAYNINTVGVILNEIRFKQRQRNKKVKIFMRMSEEDKIPNGLTNEIVSFIDQSFEIRDKFQFQQYQNIVASLPKAKASEFKKEANRNIFCGIPFANLLSKNSMMVLAEKIHRKVAHPEQIIHKKGQPFNFTILKKGQIALCCKNKSSLNSKKMQILSSQNSQTSQTSKLLSLKFLKNKPSNYDVKSLDYSVILQLSLEEIIESLKDRALDYQLLCQMRDKDQYYLNDYQIYQCELCPGERHQVFECPKLHYVVLRKFVIFRYLSRSGDVGRSSRKKGCFVRGRGTMKTLKQLMTIQEQLSEYSCGGSAKLVRQKQKIQTIKVLKNKEKGNNKTMTTTIDKEMELNSNPNKETRRSTMEVQGFWRLECDIASNFKHYLKSSNPESINKHCLSPHKSLQTRLQSHKAIQF